MHNQKMWVNIIHAGSGKLHPEKDYSPVPCDPVGLISDCKGLLGLMEKNLADVDNKKLPKILETASNYRWELTHISGKENRICDALSRLCTRICFDSHKYIIRSPRLLQMSKKQTAEEGRSIGDEDRRGSKYGSVCWISRNSLKIIQKLLLSILHNPTT